MQGQVRARAVHFILSLNRNYSEPPYESISFDMKACFHISKLYFHKGGNIVTAPLHEQKNDFLISFIIIFLRMKGGSEQYK